jgi:DNA-damage-inducible protein J
MPSVTVQSRVNPELKQQAEAIFASMGMSLADGIRIFLQQTVNIQGLPFQPSIKQPNAETIEAMNYAINGRVNRYASVDAIFKGLDNA